MKKNEIRDLETLATRFNEVLQSSSEQRIHSFLEQHVQLLGFNSWGGFVKSKFRLAELHVPDFLVVGLQPYSQDPRPLITLVEIEQAGEPLFTKSGDPTSFLTHAVRQIQDWKRWVTDNRAYFQSVLHKLILKETPSDSGTKSPAWRRDRIEQTIAYGFQDQYLVVAGRRESMKLEERLLLAQMNRDLDQIRIITYDVLLDRIFRDLDPTGPPWRNEMW